MTPNCKRDFYIVNQYAIPGNSWHAWCTKMQIWNASLILSRQTDKNFHDFLHKTFYRHSCCTLKIQMEDTGKLGGWLQFLESFPLGDLLLRGTLKLLRGRHLKPHQCPLIYSFALNSCQLLPTEKPKGSNDFQKIGPAQWLLLGLCCVGKLMGHGYPLDFRREVLVSLVVQHR